jgi:hypothetical protein
MFAADSFCSQVKRGSRQYTPDVMGYPKSGNVVCSKRTATHHRESPVQLVRQPMSSDKLKPFPSVGDWLRMRELSRSL